MQIKDNLIIISMNIAVFIQQWLQEKSGFECRSFYGETYTLALMQLLGILEPGVKHKILNAYNKIDKTDSQFHWEFNNYALLQYYRLSHDQEVLPLIYPLQFKNTPCTNWTLLRSAARLCGGENKELAAKEAREKIAKFQLGSGQILDEKKVKSFQYHCFSTAMIAEIYEQTGEKDFYDSFMLGVKFIRVFILSNGEANYIGRGQKQSFGYGALVYILALAYKYTNDHAILGDLHKVVGYLKKHQDSNGSFPLVLNGIKQQIPPVVDMTDPSYCGWYPYNNYFDYLPFMGFFIAKASTVLDELDTTIPVYKAQEDYSDSNYIKQVTKNYEAVVSTVGGYWTNDMPIPYIVSKGKSITPCYGGEQFQKSIYSSMGIPLPFSKWLNKSVRWMAVSFFKDKTLWVVSPIGIVKRDFRFYEDLIKIETKVFSWLKLTHLYLFKFDTLQKRENMLVINEVEIVGSQLTETDIDEFSSDGKLWVFKDNNRCSILEFKFR
ncbi:hypothetical protein [Anaerospora sp.]|uniref:hypothetical protein n=1 Tax=Anaerospora sp. TaxID=1960278 RepID=UPI00289FACA1|nr:hypothetical protein [Anaerospora sp.]